MRKTRFIVVGALIAVLGIAAVAYAQTNSYNVSAKVPSGGSKKKPKAGGFTFHFDIKDAGGAAVPQIVKEYSLGIEGAKVNTKVAAVCAASKINAAKDDSPCTSKALLGTGTVKAVVGTVGNATSDGDCTLALKVYNGGGNKAALFLRGGYPGSPACLAPISQAIDAKWVTKDGGTALVFTVPDSLRHQVGLDVSVISTDAKFKKIVKKIGKKKVGYFEGVGCKDKVRTVTATFTDEAGNATPVKQDVGKC